jgi:hypothetical protein
MLKQEVHIVITVLRKVKITVLETLHFSALNEAGNIEIYYIL